MHIRRVINGGKHIRFEYNIISGQRDSVIGDRSRVFAVQTKRNVGNCGRRASGYNRRTVQRTERSGTVRENDSGRHNRWHDRFSWAAAILGHGMIVLFF